MSSSLGQLTLDLVARIGSFTGPLDKASRASKKNTSDIAKHNKVLHDSYDKLLKKVGSFAAGYLSIMGAKRLASGIVGIGATFEREMATVSGVMRASEKDTEKLSDAAKLMGQTTEWTAQNSAEALRFMGMAGYSAGDAIKALPGLLNLASAAGTDLALVSDIVTDSLTAMGMGVDELSRFNDVLIGTITRSNTDIPKLGESLKYVAPIASQLGYDIEQVAAMLGILANAGIKASDAGTDLRKAMLENIDASKKLGTSENDLIGTLKAAKAAGWGVNEIVKNYGILASKSVLVIMDQIDEYENLEKQLHSVNGETDALAQKKLDTVIGDFNLLKSAIEGIGLSIFEFIEKPLRGVTQRLTKLVNDWSWIIGGSAKATERQKELNAITEEMQNLNALLREQRDIQTRLTMLKEKGAWYDPDELKQAENNIESLIESVKELNGVSVAGSSKPASPDVTGAPSGSTNDTSWGDFGKVLKATSEANKQRFEMIKSSNAAIAAENDRQLKDDIARDVELRQLKEQADLAELNNKYNGVEKEIKLHEYKYEKLKELYEEGSEELAEIERIQKAELESINDGYWDNYLEAIENNFDNMGSIVGDSLNSWTSQFGNFFASAILDSENLGDAFKTMAMGMANTVVSAIGQMIAQWLVYKAVKIATDKSTQAAAIPAIVTNAEVAALQAGINAYASAAAVPIVGWAMAPGAMAAALAVTQPMAASIAGLSVAGMAHDGINSVPETGTWLLKKGERVTTAETSQRLDDVLNRIQDGINGATEAKQQMSIRGTKEAHYHYHSEGPTFLNRAQMKDAARMLLSEMEREKTRIGAI